MSECMVIMKSDTLNKIVGLADVNLAVFTVMNSVYREHREHAIDCSTSAGWRRATGECFL